MQIKIYRMFNRRSSLIKILFWLCVVVTACILFRHIHTDYRNQSSKNSTIMADKTMGDFKCHIPKPDPFEVFDAEYIDDFVEPDCLRRFGPPMTTLLKNGSLIINSKYKQKIMRCRSHSILHEGSNDKSKLSPGEEFDTLIENVQSDFVLVKCFNFRNKIIYSNVHLQIYQERIEVQTTSDKLNVALFIHDTLSMETFKHRIPKTYEYLVNTRRGLVFENYHVTGMDTIKNMAPLLTGKSVDEFPSLSNNTNFLDNLPLLWKAFDDNGYKTYYLEETDYSTFNYVKRGFAKQPTTHYARPYFDTARNIKLIHHLYCLRERELYLDALQYFNQFLEKYQYSKYFAVHFLNNLSHDSRYAIRMADDSYANFLRHHFENGAMDNTVFIAMADHGHRDLDLESSNWKIEAALPPMIILFPERFRNKYPLTMKTLEYNTNVLVTAYDLHATMSDILRSDFHERSYSGVQRGHSLFGKIPNRTCKQAGIPENICLCRSRTEVKNASPFIKKLAKKSTDRLNSILRYNFVQIKCARLTLYRIVNIYLTVDLQKPKDEESQFQDYEIVFETIPGHAVFESLVRVYDDLGRPIVLDVIRGNRYGNQSWCVTTNRQLKEICYCKTKI